MPWQYISADRSHLLASNLIFKSARPLSPDVLPTQYKPVNLLKYRMNAIHHTTWYNYRIKMVLSIIKNECVIVSPVLYNTYVQVFAAGFDRTGMWKMWFLTRIKIYLHPPPTTTMARPEIFQGRDEVHNLSIDNSNWWKKSGTYVPINYYKHFFIRTAQGGARTRGSPNPRRISFYCSLTHPVLYPVTPLCPPLAVISSAVICI